MPGETVKFRCNQCNQMLAISRSRVGAQVACPRCGQDLRVPDPEAPLSVRDEPPPAPAPTRPEVPTSPAPESDAGFFPNLQFEPISLRDDDAPLRVPSSSPSSPATPAAAAPAAAPAATVPAPRRNDVVLPRTALIAWAIFAILALFLAFVAGLLTQRLLLGAPATARVAAEGAEPVAPAADLDLDADPLGPEH